jgi:hypothetical protein
MLRGDSLDNIMQQRFFSRDWYTYLWKGNTTFGDTGGFAVGDDPTWQEATTGNVALAFSILPMGMVMQTDGSGGDSMVLRANKSDSSISEATGFWDSNKEVGMLARVSGGTSAGNVLNFRASVGFYFSSDADPTTIGNIETVQWHVANSATAAGTWRAITRSGSTTIQDLDTREALATNTNYELGIFLDEGRRPHYFFNNRHMGHSPPIASTAGVFWPTIAIEETSAGTAGQLGISHIFLCRKWVTRGTLGA